jgi:hypothetical protein
VPKGQLKAHLRERKIERPSDVSPIKLNAPGVYETPGIVVHTEPGKQFGAYSASITPRVCTFGVIARIGVMIVRTAYCILPGGDLVQQHSFRWQQRIELNPRQYLQIYGTPL